MKKLILTTIVLFQFYQNFAQDFDFGKTDIIESTMQKYEKDTTANAVVLKEFGQAYLSGGSLNLVFNYHARVKILSTKGFEYGTVEIVLRKTDKNKFEKVTEVKGVTINVDNRGTFEISELEQNQIFKENYDKYNDVVKFTLPNLRVGSIIEFKYQIESPYVFNFRKWNFQSSIPKIYSEYFAKIPAIYNYNIALMGFQKLTSQTSKLEKECFTPGGGLIADCSNMTFIMKNIPAFIEEDYMTAAVNFKSAITFELQDYTGYNGVKVKVTKEWKDIDYELKTHEDFGKQISKKALFKDEIVSVINGKTNELEKSKAIYQYIQKRFKWNEYNGFTCDGGIKKALSSSSGNIADINLALVAAMNAAEINAEPVILSTRNNGFVNKLFPGLSNFNYVICKVDIGETSYLLDATDPLLPFGLLPLKCINDQGRVMSRSKPSYWIDIKATQRELRFYKLVLALEEDGKLRGLMELNSSGYEGLNKRKRITSYTSVDDYVENFDDNMPGLIVKKAEVKNLDALELPLIEVYEVEIDAFESLESDRLIFNPYLVSKVNENPFKLKTRSYPVDWGAASETTTFIQITFPDNFIPQNKPEKVGSILPNNGGKYLSEVKLDKNILTLQELMVLNKSIYNTGEYPYLKELYNKIIQTHKYDLVFKKEL